MEREGGLDDLVCALNFFFSCVGAGIYFCLKKNKAASRAFPVTGYIFQESWLAGYIFFSKSLGALLKFCYDSLFMIRH